MPSDTTTIGVRVGLGVGTGVGSAVVGTGVGSDVGDSTQTSLTHVDDEQSSLSVHASPTLQRGQSPPPQSTSVSEASTTSFVQLSKVGSGVGTRLGTAVGSAIGSDDGSDVGSDVGSAVGSDDGSDVGSHVGSDVGSAVGSDDGSDVGSHVGSDLGSAVGSDDGSDVGRHEGSAVGSALGSAGIGTDVGTGVGDGIGAGDGDRVGTAVGMGTGTGVGTGAGPAVGRDEGTGLGGCDTVGVMVGLSKTAPPATQKCSECGAPRLWKWPPTCESKRACSSDLKIVPAATTWYWRGDTKTNLISKLKTDLGVGRTAARDELVASVRQTHPLAAFEPVRECTRHQDGAFKRIGPRARRID